MRILTGVCPSRNVGATLTHFHCSAALRFGLLVGMMFCPFGRVLPRDPGPRRTTWFLLAASCVLTAETIAGGVSGRVVDPATGAGVAEVTVTVGGQTTKTDLDGRYSVTAVTPGVHTVEAEKLGRLPARVTGVEVPVDGFTSVDVPLAAGDVIKMEAFSVTAEVVQNSGLGLLSARQKAASVSDAIGSEHMSRLGFGTAAAAMRAVTGVSVVDNKYVYLRGLGERYSNTLVNGVEVPSADPDRRAVNMDMFPSDLIDAIVASKTFTPDRPGNFAGGSVDLKTKEFPDQFTASIGASIGHNSQVTGKRRLSYAATDRGLARDDGSRALPEAVASTRIPPRYNAPGGDVTIGELSRAFSETMTPVTDDTPYNYSAAIAFGGVYRFNGSKLGYAASVSYDRSFSGYGDGAYARYERQGVNSPALSPLLLLRDAKYEDETLIGGLFNLAYQFNPEHQVALNVMVNRSGIDQARRLAGVNVSGGGLTETDFFETRALRFTERAMDSLQLQGKHLFPNLREPKVTWSATQAKSTQDEPDTRFFSTMQAEDGNYFWEISGIPKPARYFRDLEETRDDYSIDLSLPFQSWTGTQGALKAGAAYARTERAFSERLYEYYSTGARFTGDEQDFFRHANVGQVNPATNVFRPGTLYLVDSTVPANAYTGLQRVVAEYAMVDLPVLPQVRVIAGVRNETTFIDVRSRDPGRRQGLIDERDPLPSVNAVWAISPKMNLRAAWTRTLARPNFREIADYTSYEFVGGEYFVGNPDLERTRIENWDLRWEWFPRRGELFAVSVFAKELSNPIERGVFTVINAGEFQYKNAARGRVRGIELEGRKHLDVLGDRFGEFRLGANFTLLESEVDITGSELTAIRAFEPQAPATRDLIGQSPYVANVDLSWTQPRWGTTLSVYYNVFGERLSRISPPGTPNVYEQPAPSLNLVWSQSFGVGWKFTASVRNLLDSEAHETLAYRDVVYDRIRYKRGVTASVGLSYKF